MQLRLIKNILRFIVNGIPWTPGVYFFNIYDLEPGYLVWDIIVLQVYPTGLNKDSYTHPWVNRLRNKVYIGRWEMTPNIALYGRLIYNNLALTCSIHCSFLCLLLFLSKWLMEVTRMHNLVILCVFMHTDKHLALVFRYTLCLVSVAFGLNAINGHRS